MKAQIGEKDQYRYYRFTEPKKDDFAKDIKNFSDGLPIIKEDVIKILKEVFI